MHYNLMSGHSNITGKQITGSTSQPWMRLLMMLFLGMNLVNCALIRGEDTASVNARMIDVVEASDQGPRTVAVDASEYAECFWVASWGSDDLSAGSQEKPWRTIQHALARIDGASTAHRIALLVGEGSYAGETLHMKPHVDLWGGFDRHGQRDIFNHPSILDGQGQRRVLVGADHSRLDGFIVVNGRVRGKGGALLCEGVSPIVTNNRFFDNETLGPAISDMSYWTNPMYWHRTAHDGAAIACLGPSAPVIERNLFARNRTRIGRGGAIACDGNVEARIAGNLFVNNTTGLDDSMRSSDGGAVSLYDRCHGEIANNFFIGNRTLNRNDGGAFFIELWSAPRLANNVIVGNVQADDGGAFYLAGQKHNYTTPLDPTPDREAYQVPIEGNLIAGNGYPGEKSEGMRITAQARVILSDNIVAHNFGGSIFQRSDIILDRNTFVGPVLYKGNLPQQTEKIAQGTFRRSIFAGPLTLEDKVEMKDCTLLQEHDEPKALVDEAQTIEIARWGFDPDWQQAVAIPADPAAADSALPGRVIRVGDAFSVVAMAGDGQLRIWGDLGLEHARAEVTELVVMPTYALPQSAAADVNNE